MTGNVTRYLPGWVLDHLSTRAGDTLTPSHQSFEGAVLFTDLTGFSRLTDSYDRKGPEGAELLTAVLNTYFGRMTDVAISMGGDVVEFMGDAIVVVWPSAGDPAGAVASAVRCGLAMQSALEDVSADTGLPLQQRISINTGELSFCTVGGADDRWHWIVAGEPMIQAGGGYYEAEPGEVLVCAPAWQLVRDDFEALQTESGNAVISTGAQIAEAALIPQVSRSLEVPDTAHHFLPVVERKLALGDISNWLGEFRNVTIVFVHFSDIMLDVPEGLTRLQTAVDCVQARLTDYGGSFEQLSMDDKGISALIAFGLPFMAQEDDVVRALQAAMEIQQALEKNGIASSTGVARGRMFCGDCGGDGRRHFARVGDTVVIAARLMTAGQGTLYCDEATMQSASKDFEFSEAVALKLKGKTKALPGYSPKVHVRRETLKFSGAMVDRQEERKSLTQALNSLAQGQGCQMVLSGEAGIGKSRLLSEATRMADERDVHLLNCTGSAIHSTTPYYPWRQVLAQVLVGDEDYDAERALQTLMQRLEGNERLRAWVPLLKDLIHLPLEDNDITRGMTGPARASSLQMLMVHLLEQHCAGQLTMLVVDDLHWFDEASAGLLSYLMLENPGLRLMILAASRPADQANKTASKLLQDLADKTLVLDALPRADLGEFIEQKLAVRGVPEQLVEFVHERTGGHALYSEELLQALQKDRFIETIEGQCRLTAKFQSSQLGALPDTMEGVIVTHIDRLDARAQMFLKTLSVIGREFSRDMVDDVAPEFAQGMDALIAMAMEEGFLVVVPSTSGVIYAFRHAVLRDVIYGLLPYNQRREMHAQMAQWIEQQHASALPAHAVELAHHWRAAGDITKALQYLQMAAEQALRNYSNGEAIQHVQAAYSLLEKSSDDISDERRAHWESLLGEAHHELFEYAVAERHYHRSLRLYGYPVPASKGRLIAGFLKQTLLQVCHRAGFVPGRRRLGQPQRDVILHVAHMHERLSESAYFDSRMLLLLFHTLASLNFAERANATREIVACFGALAIGLAQGGLRGWSESYNRKSLGTAEQEGKREDVAYAHLLNMVVRAGDGSWQSLEHSGEVATSIYQQLGAENRWLQSCSLIYHTRCLRAAFSEAEALLAENKAALKRDTPAQIRSWVYCSEQHLALVNGELTLALVDKLREVQTPDLHSSDLFRCQSMIAIALWRLGEQEGALNAADSALNIMSTNPPTSSHVTDGATVLAEIYLEAVKRLGTVHPSDPLWKKATQACRGLLAFSKPSPVALPRAMLQEGRRLKLAGNDKKAHKLWTEAIKHAERLEMPLDKALLLSELSKLDTANAGKYQQEAQHIYRQLGARNFINAEFESEPGTISTS